MAKLTLSVKSAIESGKSIIFSTDSLRDSDIISGILAMLNPGTDDVQSILYDSPKSDRVDLLVNLVQDILDGLNLPACPYIGAHPGDGACFGIWFMEEE